MIITGVSYSPIINPLATPFITSLRRVDRLESLVLKLETDTGLTGYGAAAPTKAITGEDLDSLKNAFSGPVTGIFTNSSFENHRQHFAVLQQKLPRQNSALAAVSIALYDLAAKQQQVPLYELLGPGRTIPPTSYTISLDTPIKMEDQAEAIVSRGFSILKIKVGGRDNLDTERMAAVTSKCDSKIRFYIDPNQAWSVQETLTYMEVFQKEQYPIDFIEQPLPADDIKGMAALVKAGIFPIAADESVFTPADAACVIEASAADIINIKLMKCGGLEEALKICRLAEEAGRKIMVGCMLEGAVSVLAAMHLAYAQPVVKYVDLDSPLLFKEMPEELKNVYYKNRIHI